MHLRGKLALAFALASLFGIPALASAAIVQRWQSLPANYYVVSPINDFIGDGHYEMLTIEPASGGAKIGVRSASTGAVLAQTTGVYQPGPVFWVTYLEDTNEIAEIIFSDVATGNLVCVNYTGGSTLPVRWSFLPTSSGVPPTWVFADLDGTGLDMVFKDPLAGTYKYYVRDRNGALVTTIDHSTIAPGSGWTSSLIVDDFENAGNRQDLMIDYHHSSPAQDIYYLYGSNGLSPMAPAAAPSALNAARTVRRAARRFERVDGTWAEVGAAKPESAADQPLVRLP